MALLNHLFDYLLVMAGWIVVGIVLFYVLVTQWRRSKDNPRRRLFLQIGLSTWMVLALLTLVELYFAVIYDSTDSFSMTNVSKKWYAVHADPQRRPLEISNGAGFNYRDVCDFPKRLADGQQRVCFFGDSFTFGHGIPRIEDRFSNRVAVELEKKRPGEFVVANLGDAGIDLHWIELQLTKLFEAGFQIDTAVYVICLNDIETFHPRHATFYNDFSERVGAPKFFLFRDTYFFNLMYFRLRQSSVPEVTNYYEFVQEYYDGEPWQKMQLKLDQVAELCSDNDADFRIVIFPFLHNLGPEYPFRSAHQQIVDYCQNKTIPVVDLEPILSKHVEEGLIVSRFDAHPNERANELAAEAIQNDLFRDFFSNGPAEKKSADSTNNP